MTVTVFDLCPVCNELKEKVEKRRQHGLYWYSKAIELTSCQPCFDAEVERQKQNTSGYGT